MPISNGFMGKVAGIENVSFGIISVAARFARPFIMVFAPSALKELDMAVKAANALHAMVQTGNEVNNESGAGMGVIAGMSAAARIVKDMITNPKGIAILSAGLQGTQEAVEEAKKQAGVS